MGQCGCSNCGQTFKLPAPDGWYVIRTIPACDYCDHGPMIDIQRPDSKGEVTSDEHIGDIPDLPFLGDDGYSAAYIKCGLDCEQTRKAFVRQLSGGDDPYDADMAEIIGEEFWKMEMGAAPEVAYTP